MDDKFDDSLKKQISKVFENVESPTADEGWLMLREKFPEKEKDRPVIWLWRAAAAAAAVAILLIGISKWANHQNNETKTIAKKLPKFEQVKEKHDELAVKKTPELVTDSGIYFNNTSPDKKIVTTKTNSTPHLVTGNIAKQIVSNKHISPDGHISPKRDIDNSIQNNLPTISSPNTIAANDVTNIIKDSAMNKPVQMAVKQQPTEISQLPKNTSYTVQNNEPIASITIHEKKVKFGVYAATYINYAKGSENQINMGVGFTSDIKISKKIKLSTGVAIAQNSLNYINQPSSSTSLNLLYNGATLVNTTLGVANAYNFTNAQSAPTIKDYNALLVGLDIPLNLKYEFNPSKSRSYVIVGLSSGTFINESYTYNFNTITRSYVGNSLFANQQQPESQTTKNSFNDFYFARTLNISFGIGYPLGKNHLIIEPFLKYPLAGLGTQQIHFGAGGINLKFDFLSSPKK